MSLVRGVSYFTADRPPCQGQHDLRVRPSGKFFPPVIKGLTVSPEEPTKSLRYYFDKGSSNTLSSKEEARLIEYFSIALLTEAKEWYVNLSPYEEDNVISDTLAQTCLGTGFLEFDCFLKRFACSQLHPAEEWGNEYWKSLRSRLGTRNQPISIFPKVWIKPDKITLCCYADEDCSPLVAKKQPPTRKPKSINIFVKQIKLKVSCDRDALAIRKNCANASSQKSKKYLHEVEKAHEHCIPLLEKLILPIIEREVNEGENFQEVRQMTYAIALATWYKKEFKHSISWLDSNKLDELSISISKKPTSNDLETSQTLTLEKLNAADVKRKYYQKYLSLLQDGIWRYSQQFALGYQFYFSGGIHIIETPTFVAR